MNDTVTIGSYRVRILKTLGEGGFATVQLVENTQTDERFDKENSQKTNFISFLIRLVSATSYAKQHMF